jgi:parvulin-like peptidyl-prolyl isomerase
LFGCDRSVAPDQRRAAENVIGKLPAPIRERFATAAGRREMERALDDKALLVAEARRHEFHERPDIRTAVQELENKLIVQALLEQERATVSSTEPELRAYYDAHRADFRLPARRETSRILVADADPTAAQQRIDGLKKRLAAGEPFAVVAAAGDGAERITSGRLGHVNQAQEDRALADAVFAAEVGKVVGPVRVRDGQALLLVTAVLPASEQAFEAVRGVVENKLQPTLQRRSFERLVERLRTEADRE